MREIKFRAYTDGAMMYSHKSNLGFEEYEKLSIFFNDIMPYSILMQFTGLKDKNGIDIYEDDILTGMFADSFKTERNYHRRNVTVIHFLEQQGFCSGFNHKHVEDGLSAFNVPPLKYEVIGNIYEHPHLIPKEVMET